MPLKQESRSIAIKTPLGADALGLRSFSVEEQLSHLFQIEAALSSENGAVNLDEVVGHAVTIRLNLSDKSKRFFNGYVSGMVQQANEGGYARYRATIVPWLWFLTRTSDCRLWAADQPAQGKTVPQIIEEVFKGHGFHDYKLKLSGHYPKREFCVQYRETDFNFVSRLMEQEGIYYFFEHEDGKHTLILADSISAHKPFTGYSDVTFHQVETKAPVREVITDWTMKKEVQPVAATLQDFDFTKPRTSLLVSTHVSRKYGQAKFEIFDYPGEYFEHGDGQRLADTRLEELQTQYETLQGQAHARGLAAGHTFKLKNHPRTEQNREYLITSVSLHAEGGEFASGQGGGEFFTCNFTCIGKAQQFRPPRVTPKPIIQGPQTATVVGPSGQELYTDKYARVKVHFHWDRHDKSDENSSCWIRVSQPWAGKGYGGTSIPRIGQEVVVEFLEGDPDRPLVNGRIYNAGQMPYGSKAGAPELDRIKQKVNEVASKTKMAIAPPSGGGGGGGGAPASGATSVLTAVASAIAGGLIASMLAKLGKAFDKKGANPAHASIEDSAMMTTIKSNSLGGSGGSNEITLSDSPGAESLFIKAERDKVVSVNNDYTTTVDNDMIIDVKGKRHTMINGKDTLNVNKDSETTVGKRYSLTIAKAAVIKIKGVLQQSVGANHELTISRDAKTNIKRDSTTNVMGKGTYEIGKDSSFRVGGKHTVEIEKDRTTTVKGEDKLTVEKTETIEIKKDIKVTGGTKIEIEAKDQIVLKCGSASITLKSGGDIEIKGSNIKMEATGDLKGKGAAVTSEATGNNTIKGAMVMIN
jgi:type VI secretion system secreted protein VgrG